MSDIAIQVENLSKRYRIGLKEEMHDTFTGAITSWLKYPLTNFKKLQKLSKFNKNDSSEDIIWALKDVSFEVNHGEVLGIIGRNGAGKSTLLKVLCRITEPTYGYAKINGRVASLLEVGTGFHPELTGRENIYLNGTVLGMKKKEIDKKFDEIVDFSGVEKFIDTPVKRYSSGMTVRLAFSVAAHLEPEILLIDEVLAVGDFEFQKKCLGKMKDVATGGRTVLFVSHNMAAVNQLCKRAICIEKGSLSKMGTTGDVIRHYINRGINNSSVVELANFLGRQGTGKIQFKKISLNNNDFSLGDDIIITIDLNNHSNLKSAKIAIEIRTDDGIPICNMLDQDSGFNFKPKDDLSIIQVIIPDLRLYPGRYYLTFWIGSRINNEVYDKISDCINFNVIDGGKYTFRNLPRTTGLFFLTPNWSEK